MEINSQIEKIIEDSNVGNGISLKLVKTKSDIKSILDSGLGIDYRIKHDDEELNIEDIEFSKDKITSITFYIENENNEIVGVSSIVITPKIIFKNNKYFKLEGENIKLVDFEMLENGELDFLITHAWTKIKEEYRGKLIHRVFKTNKMIFDKLIEVAPENSGIEIVAMGKLMIDNKKDYNEKIEKIGIGNSTSFSKMPFKKEIFGIPHNSSRATSSYAEHLGLSKLENIAQYNTLGPVYFKKIR